MKYIVKHAPSNEFLLSNTEGMPFMEVASFTDKREQALEFVCPVIAQAEIMRLQKHDPELTLSVEPK